MLEDVVLMTKLENMIEYTSSKMQKTISSGTGMYEYVADVLSIFSAGSVRFLSTQTIVA